MVLETGDLVFSDKTRITPKEIWDFMTIQGPKRFPYAFSTNPSYGHQLSRDITLISGIRRNYLNLTGLDRIREFVRKKIPLVMEQGGIISDIYYAAGCIPIVPHALKNWIMNDQEGWEFKDANTFGSSLFEEARQNMTVECCNLIAPLGLLKTKNVPIAAIAPSLCSRCSDMGFASQAYHNESGTIPTFLMDYPNTHECGEWGVDYLKDEIITFAERLGKISGKEVTDDGLRDEIKRENQVRNLARECQYAWWSGKVPPTNSIDGNFTHLGRRGSYDFQIANQVLKETRDEIRTRVHDGVKGYGLCDEPTRIFTCGSCVRPNPQFVDKKGGVLVGRDDGWSSVTVDVKETGDPFENLAVAYSSLPYERSTEERAEWTVQQLKDSKSDGVLFMYNWGCNYQSAVSEMIIDIIIDQTGLPAISIEVEMMGQMETSEQSQNRVESFIEMIR
jgi:benzoyl-CoA reductase/2-hydroxyglutaryl-CoA dehydratase subunit BcrC/BadD/HgdB